jgi:glycosyltransferase involved in cell wall biosynthesis
MRIALLTTDNRENYRKYELEKPYFGTAPEGLIEGFSKIPELEVHVISCTQRVMASPSKLAENIWFHSLPVPKSGWLRTGYQGCIRAVRKKLKEIQPDIVHGQGTERDCAISAFLSNYPKLLTIHGNLRLIKKQVGFKPFSAIWFQSILEGIVVPRFDGIICITNYTQEAVASEVKRTWVVPNAVDLSFLELGKDRIGHRSDVSYQRTESSDSGFRFQLSNSPPIILVVANIDPRKNQINFIQSLDALSQSQRFEVRFFGNCGSDAYGLEFLSLVKERSWCSYGGMIGREELRREFETASMLALPTHEDNCPMVVLEAMATGVPVMASKVGGVPDLIDGISTGLFCDPCDPESFSVGVTRLLENRDFADQMAITAFHEAMNRFHPKVIAERHLEIYREVLDDN